MFRGEESMKKIALLLIASIFSVSNVQADNFLTLGLAAGTAGQQYSDIYTDAVGISSVSGNDTSIGIRIGVPLSNYVLMEGAIYDYGEANDDYFDGFGDLISVKLSTTSVNFGMAGIFPISYTPVDIIGRIGFAAWESEVEFRDSSVPGDVLTDKDDGIAVYLGFGARTSVAKNVRLGFEYTFFGFDTNFTNVAGEQFINNFALTVDVGF